MTRMRSYLAGPGALPPLMVRTRSADAGGAAASAMMIVDNGSSRRRRISPPVTERVNATGAFLRARKWFLTGRRVDMSGLAAELGVSRVTLYRWVGSRDRLLVDVIWSLARRTLDNIEAEVQDGGPEKVVRVVTRFLEDVISNAGMQRWLAEEGESAMRLLTRAQNGFQPRLIDAMHDLLTEEADAGRLDLPVDLREVAYVIVRLIESYTYLDLITGEQPDARRAEPILRLLLRA
jgi:AcrR family transcriptional regulator